ncbi:MAG: DNA polymerase III subunit chi [Idiomarinaceae bacterium]|nr:DNA polymerase III subunit chi [Idiomarinaceae bacterium]
MPSATFFLVQTTDEDEKNNLICDKIADLFRQYRKLLVVCEDQQQAELFDELLWQRPADGFIPHALVGEALPNGAPATLSWRQSEQQPRTGMALFNLASQVPEIAQRSQHIFDLVPAPEDEKAVARERYKHYRARGCQMRTEPLTAKHN